MWAILASMIRTDRLLLRRWRHDDRAPFAAMNADPEVRAFLQGTIGRQESDAFIDAIEAHWDAERWGLWALEVVDSGAFIGHTGLWPADFLPGGPAVEVGWRLARHHWGHGYATEAARAALRFGFEELGLEEIVSFTVPQNVRSIRVMERLGLARYPAGDFDHPRVDAKRYPQLVRHVLYRLERSQWRPSKAASS
jgi:RimJ/RimL family protein N-acetyltransferase